MSKIVKTLLLILLVFAMACPVYAGATPNKSAEISYTIKKSGSKYITKFYDKNNVCVAKYATKWKPKRVVFFDANDYEYGKITNRTRSHIIYIEVDVGKVVNKRGDGKLLNVSPPYNYISYKGVRGAKKGKTIRTYCIYNPNNNYDDDIDCRVDYVLH